MQQWQKINRHHQAHDSDVLSEESNEEEEFARDEFNLNKLIVIVTASGKVQKSTSVRLGILGAVKVVPTEIMI